MIDVVQEAVVPVQIGSAPPMLTVAVTLWPERPVVSTVIVEVPWPLLIVPAETDQLYVHVAPGAPPDTEAVYVIGWLASTSVGQLTETTGHGGGGGTQPEQSATVTVVLPLAVC